MYNVDFSVIGASLPQIYEGLITTCYICVVSFALAFLLASLVTYFRIIKSNKIVEKFAVMFVEFIRNTPLLLQIYVVFKLLPQIGLTFSPIACGIIALSVYQGVYFSEVMRSGIAQIKGEQMNAAFALGFSPLKTFTLIIFPQGLKNVISPLGSQVINLIKNSSLLSFIAVSDIFYVSYQKIADDFRIIEYFTVCLVLYTSLTGIVLIFTHILNFYLKIKYKEVAIA